MKKLLILIIIIFFALSTSAGFIKGHITVQPDKLNYQAGETINLQVETFNSDSVVIANGYIYATLAYYPSSNGSGKLILAEDFKRNINLAQSERKFHNLNLSIPTNIFSSDYRIEVYFVTENESISGFTSTLDPGNYKDIKITGSQKMPHIEPNLSTIEKKQLTVGPVIDKDNFQMKLFPLNNPQKIKVEVFSWDHTLGDEPLLTKEFTDLENITMPFDVTPGAYSVKVSVLENNKPINYTVFRLIKKGLSARISDVKIADTKLTANNKFNIEVSALNSADALENQKAFRTILIANLITNEKQTLQKEFIFTPEKASISDIFSFDVKRNSDTFKIQLTLIDEQVNILDSRTIDINNLNFSPGLKTLNLSLLNQDTSTDPIKIKTEIKNGLDKPFECETKSLYLIKKDTNSSIIGSILLFREEIEDEKTFELNLNQISTEGLHELLLKCDEQESSVAFCFGKKSSCEPQKEKGDEIVPLEEIKESPPIKQTEVLPLWVLFSAIVFFIIVGIGFLYMRKYSDHR